MRIDLYVWSVRLHTCLDHPPPRSRHARTLEIFFESVCRGLGFWCAVHVYGVAQLQDREKNPVRCDEVQGHTFWVAMAYGSGHMQLILYHPIVATSLR